jgi:hypothetical protein
LSLADSAVAAAGVAGGDDGGVPLVVVLARAALPAAPVVA